MDVFVLRK